MRLLCLTQQNICEVPPDQLEMVSIVPAVGMLPIGEITPIYLSTKVNKSSGNMLVYVCLGHMPPFLAACVPKDIVPGLQGGCVHRFSRNCKQFPK